MLSTATFEKYFSYKNLYASFLLCALSLLLYFTVSSAISVGCGGQASLMLFV